MKYKVLSKSQVGSSFYRYTKGDRAYLKLHEFIRTPFNPIEWAMNQRRGLHNFSLDFLASHRYYCLSDDFPHNPLMLNELSRRKERDIKNTKYRSQESAYYARQKEVFFPSLLYSDFLLLHPWS